ncbi:MAG: Glycosyl transferase, family 4 [Candidatus Berkelbacteria bacterium Licking1014_2]|uniref:Glycosyl transferase, family 4 n=1 Tax=Candidatus Berkelbacteria bacterium Licking1014_2 TaxID=2017146 RepID=A0A554LX35_9BACT|nr:MAG: Glycosyl transferase, family 4 [Candidatus Berkelbacteria bacterium Licking1014_2]
MIYLFPFLSSFFLTLILTPLIRRLAIRKNVVDRPGGRHIHSQPTAKWGGLAIAISFWLVVLIVYSFNTSRLDFSPWKISRLDANLLGMFLGSLILVILGALDDKRALPPWVKLAGQIIASAIVVGFGVKIWWITNPFGGLNWDLGWLTYILVPLWLVMIINAVNWVDGLDGLAGSLSLAAALILLFLGLKPDVNQPAMALLATVLAGTLVGFLPYNLPPAKIFLGDSGSLFLGFMLGVFAIISGAKLATAALVLGVVIIDALWVIVGRLRRRQPVWQGDANHLHHRLLAKGWSQRQIVLLYLILAIGFGLVGIFGHSYSKFWGLVIMAGVVTTISLYANIKNKI